MNNVSEPAGVTSKTFERFAAACALAVGVGGVAYSVAFFVAIETGSDVAVTATAILLLAGGLLTTPVLVALHQRLRSSDEAFAQWALLLGVVGAMGTAVHGGFDLGTILRGPTLSSELPNPVDPRGLLTFAVTGISVLVFATLIRSGGGLPRGLGVLGLAAGILLVLVYLGRLVIFDPTEPVLVVVAAAAGFLVSPAWFIWLGIALRRA